MQPIVSFVVPCYNYGQFVAQAVDSLLSQTIEPLEVIVIDDASADDSPDVLRRYEAEPRVTLIRHDQNQGHLRTYNEGLSLARGEYLGLMSADDFCLRKDAVERQVAFFEAHPSVGFVACSYAFTDEDGRIEWVKSPWEHDIVRNGLDEFSRLAFQNYIPHSGTLIRRSCHDQLGFYDLRLPHAADWDMWLRISARFDVAYVADALYAYRMHPRNMHHSTVSPRIMTSDHVLTIQKAFDGLPVDAPPAVRLLRKKAIEQAWVRSAAVECSAGRTRRSAVALFDAAVHAPNLLLTRTFAVAALKAIVQSVIGQQNYSKLATRWSSRRWPAR